MDAALQRAAQDAAKLILGRVRPYGQSIAIRVLTGSGGSDLYGAEGYTYTSGSDTTYTGSVGLFSDPRYGTEYGARQGERSGRVIISAAAHSLTVAELVAQVSRITGSFATGQTTYIHTLLIDGEAVEPTNISTDPVSKIVLIDFVGRSAS